MEKDLKDLGQLDVGNILQSVLEKPKDKTATVQCNPNTPMSSKESETEIDYEELSYYEEECLTINCIRYVFTASLSFVQKYILRKQKKIKRTYLNEMCQEHVIEFEESEIDEQPWLKPRFDSERKIVSPSIVKSSDEKKLNQEIIENNVDNIIEREEWAQSFNFPEEKYVKEKKARKPFDNDKIVNQRTDLNDSLKDTDDKMAIEIEVNSQVSSKIYKYKYDDAKMWSPTEINAPFTPGLVFEVNYYYCPYLY